MVGGLEILHRRALHADSYQPLCSEWLLARIEHLSLRKNKPHFPYVYELKILTQYCWMGIISDWKSLKLSWHENVTRSSSWIFLATGGFLVLTIAGRMETASFCWDSENNFWTGLRLEKWRSNEDEMCFSLNTYPLYASHTQMYISKI